MKLKPVKLAPALIAVFVIVLVCLVRLLRLDFFERLERVTYDMRVRAAQKSVPAIATNLGFIYIDDASIDFVKTNTSLGYRFGLYWPRQVYGRLIEELAAQNARAVALDVIFGELRQDHPPVQMADGRLMESDDFLALQMRRAGNVIIATTEDVKPPDLFATNALALGDITTIRYSAADKDTDPDGILRRARAFRSPWHWAFRRVAADPNLRIDLKRARVESDSIHLPMPNGEEIRLPLAADGTFDLADFFGEELPAGIPRRARPFTDERVWHMGIVLAARELGLDLANAEVNLRKGEIVLRGKNGVERTIPVDENACFYIDWSIPHDDSRLSQEPIRNLLLQDRWRLDGQTNGLSSHWAGKLVVVGSSATGNDLTDRGATPIDSDTLLASEHWNVANSLILGRFVRRSSLAADLLLIVVMGIAAAVLTWRFRALLAFLLVVLLAVGYVALGKYLYLEHRYWLPLIAPVSGALLMTYVCLVTWRVIFEQAEQRRIKSIFSTVVSPKIMVELLKAEKLSLGGARREITVLFADVRGFTELTDTSQERVAEFVRNNRLAGEAAEACYDEQAREILATVNLYLGRVAETVIKHDATLDKFIGDCVMAFWGAPVPTPRHAVACVRAAIEAQRAICELNRQRMAENKERETENLARVSTGLPPRTLLPVLLLGSGINTGMATAGLMGSETVAGVRQGNYTVFGREVNLASRLESLSGRGRILISEATYQCLLRDDPALAATCLALPDANVKGIRSAVKVYEVPWLPPGATIQAMPSDTDHSSETTTFTQLGKF